MINTWKGYKKSRWRVFQCFQWVIFLVFRPNFYEISVPLVLTAENLNDQHENVSEMSNFGGLVIIFGLFVYFLLFWLKIFWQNGEGVQNEEMKKSDGVKRCFWGAWEKRKEKQEEFWENRFLRALFDVLGMKVQILNNIWSEKLFFRRKPIKIRWKLLKTAKNRWKNLRTHLRVNKNAESANTAHTFSATVVPEKIESCQFLVCFRNFQAGIEKEDWKNK